MKPQFSIRRLLGAVTAVCIALSTYQYAVSAKQKKQWVVEACILASVAALAWWPAARRIGSCVGTKDAVQYRMKRISPSRCFELLGRIVFMYFMAFVGMVLASGSYNPYMTVGGGLLGPVYD